MTNDTKTRSSWDSMIDPESYDLFADDQTKHILWCNDHQCATTFGYASLTVTYESLSSCLETCFGDGPYEMNQVAAALQLGRAVHIQRGKQRRNESW